MIMKKMIQHTRKYLSVLIGLILGLMIITSCEKEEVINEVSLDFRVVHMSEYNYPSTSYYNCIIVTPENDTIFDISGQAHDTVINFNTIANIGDILKIRLGLYGGTHAYHYINCSSDIGFYVGFSGANANQTVCSTDTIK